MKEVGRVLLVYFVYYNDQNALLPMTYTCVLKLGQKNDYNSTR